MELCIVSEAKEVPRMGKWRQRGAEGEGTVAILCRVWEEAQCSEQSWLLSRVGGMEGTRGRVSGNGGNQVVERD